MLEQTLARFGSFDARAEYAIWALIAWEGNIAEPLQAELASTVQRWNPRTRELNQAMVRKLNAAVELARKRA